MGGADRRISEKALPVFQFILLLRFDEALLEPPMVISGIGKMGVIRDPTGVVVALMNPTGISALDGQFTELVP